MPVSRYISESMEKSSWIRRMFEEGAVLKAKFGAQNVFDFSLGNPDLSPPESFFNALNTLCAERQNGKHGYMPNSGFPEVTAAMAKKVRKDHDVDIEGRHIVMTCGAAGGLNVVLKTILNKGDEVIVPSPFFVEYGFYVENHGGVLVQAGTNDDFSLNIGNIERAITPKTRAILINSPHNPTGTVYSESQIKELAQLLEKQTGRIIYMVADEPYREIVFDGVIVPGILKHYRQSIAVTSFSKTLSLPGERIGYIAVNPSCAEVEKLMGGLILSNRILGFVNAPALMQRAVALLTEAAVDVDAYRRRRDLLVNGLYEAGYSFPKPSGAFYVFCKSPTSDDVAFVRHLLRFNILAVPGVGFAGPGNFRLAYCVSEEVIRGSLTKFREALQTFKA
jgi:aspartate aminotransferase